MIYRNKSVLKGKEISVMESLTAKRIKMLEDTGELHGFVNVSSQDDNKMFFNKTKSNVNIFYNWNFNDVEANYVKKKLY